MLRGRIKFGDRFERIKQKIVIEITRQMICHINGFSLFQKYEGDTVFFMGNKKLYP
jgi:hypothetical protein